MGIFCEIMMHKGKNTFKKGDNVSGVIRYAVDKDTTFKNITISLKGSGNLVLTRTNTRNNHTDTYRRHEDYVDIDEVHLGKETIIPTGCYEIPFSFILQQNIPASIEYRNHLSGFRVYCNIKYYVRIKFEKPETFSFTKRFKKPITVLPKIMPRLPMVPVMHGKQEKLIRLFSSEKSIVNIKAITTNCVIRPQGKFQLQLEVSNETHLKINWIEVKLRQMYTFKTNSRVIHKSDDIYETKSGQVEIGDTKTVEISLQAPQEAATLENAKIVARDYFLVITAGVPFPHFNVTMEIPVQIGDYDEENEEMTPEHSDNPPSYWEVMNEEAKDDKDMDTDVDIDDKYAKEKI